MQQYKRIDSLFYEQALKNPDKIAVSDVKCAISYKELNRLADCFASVLVKQYKVAVGDCVALVPFDKKVHILVAIIAILKVGASYTIINSEYPLGKINSLIQLTKSSCVISDRASHIGHCIDFAVVVEGEKLLDHLPVADQDEKTIAYVAHTSGTTGQPKSVAITHQNLLATYFSWETIYQLTQEDRHLQMANVGFDVFTGDWVRALCSGATLFLCQHDMLLDSKKLAGLIASKKITVAEFVPATLNLLTAYLHENNRELGLRLLVCGSDLWTVGDCKKTLLVCSKDTSLYNSYGVSEATIDSTYYKVSNESLVGYKDTDIVPIGEPFPHVSVGLLDENQEDLLPDNAGELVIGGLGVSPLGYLAQSELNAKKFILDKENVWKNRYRTGDFATIKNGCVIFLGRNEEQTNINGRRINLVAVEFSLSLHPKVEHAVVIADRMNNDLVRIKAFLVLNNDHLQYKEIRDFLKPLLTLHCLPHQFFQIEQLPLTPNGKVNRKVEAMRIIKNIESEFNPPRNKLEREITKIFSLVLQLDERKISVTDKFEELGGSSLLFTQIRTGLAEKFGIYLSSCGGVFSIEDISKLIEECQETQTLSD